jgi:hypothetical protein
MWPSNLRAVCADSCAVCAVRLPEFSRSQHRFLRAFTAQFDQKPVEPVFEPVEPVFCILAADSSPFIPPSLLFPSSLFHFPAAAAHSSSSLSFTLHSKKTHLCPLTFGRVVGDPFIPAFSIIFLNLCNIPKNIDQKLIFGAWMRERVVGRWMQSQETSEASFLSPTKP